LSEEPEAWGARVNAMSSRFGDHAGALSSSGPDVRAVSPVLSGLTTCIW